MGWEWGAAPQKGLGSSGEGAKAQAAQPGGLAEHELLQGSSQVFLWVPKTSDAFPVTKEKHMGKDKIRNYDDRGTGVRKPLTCLRFPSPDQAAQEGVVPWKSDFHLSPERERNFPMFYTFPTIIAECGCKCCYK